MVTFCHYLLLVFMKNVFSPKFDTPYPTKIQLLFVFKEESVKIRNAIVMKI